MLAARVEQKNGHHMGRRRDTGGRPAENPNHRHRLSTYFDNGWHEGRRSGTRNIDNQCEGQQFEVQSEDEGR
jgi:hypothetical protein